MKVIGILIYTVIIILGLSFASINSNLVHFEYYFGSKELPLSVLLICILLFGVFIGFFANFIVWFKLSWKNRKLEKKINNLQKEISQLRLLAVRD